MSCCHNGYPDRFYQIYTTIKARCEQPNQVKYKEYGGRGIKCLWHNFKEFYDDMYESYVKHYNDNEGDTTIDRIDTNGNYCKDNCRWLTNKEQQMTRRNVNLIVDPLDNKTLTMPDFCRKHDISYSCLKMRLYRGQTLEFAYNALKKSNSHFIEDIKTRRRQGLS